jgi:glycosyltransferase involved in cell wall biosynthesis
MGHRFVFWQNINSIHQSAFLKALAARHEVTLVTTEPGTGRSYMGWDEPELLNVRVLSFDAIDWKALVRSRRSPGDWHVFAGLQAFRKVHAAFLYALESECRTGLYAEPLRMEGLAGVLKRIRGTYDSRRFGGRIDFVLCIGPQARRQFLEWGFPPHKLHPWAYVTESPTDNPAAEGRGCMVRGVFPASLIHRKGADILLDAVDMLRDTRGLRIDAYSIHPGKTTFWQRRLIERAHSGRILRIHPFIGNRSLVRELSNSDFTVLPSRFDGWGAVVNESLSVGTPAIVSPHCGAAELLESRAWLGKVLRRADAHSLADAIEVAVCSGVVGASQRRRIADWAQDSISGERLCGYFLDIVDRAESFGTSVLRAPWEGMPAQSSLLDMSI